MKVLFNIVETKHKLLMFGRIIPAKSFVGYYRLLQQTSILFLMSYNMDTNDDLVCVFLISSALSCFSFQLLSSTLATQTTGWMKVMALWRCRCGGQALISPKEERSQYAPERQILFQLRVRGRVRHLSLRA